MQVLEFVCVEPECQKGGVGGCPLLCYICKDHGRHKGHNYALMEIEADKMRGFVADAVAHLRKFMEEITETARKLGLLLVHIHKYLVKFSSLSKA